MSFPAVIHDAAEIKPLVFRLAYENYYDFLKHGRLDLASSKAVYQTEPLGFNIYRDARDVERIGYGDCEDWTAWLLALCWLDNIYAVPGVIEQTPTLYHIVAYVFWDGRWYLADPSCWKGMSGCELFYSQYLR